MHEMAPQFSPSPHNGSPVRQLARITFSTLLLTFIISRLLVILIMIRAVPDLFLHMRGTHVHHLNYGIFLLSAVGAVLLFAERLTETQRKWCAFVYGFGLALTFDEFGMWLHLGGSYWQRASFDAIIVLLTLFAVIGFAPKWQRMRSHHFITGAVLFLFVAVFYFALLKSLNYAGKKVGPKLHEIEELGPQ
jgi:hypothetical protein